MNSSRWDVPFADRNPLELTLSNIRLDQYGWWVDVEALGQRSGKWRLLFSDVLGFKHSNESYFDWRKWSDRLEASHQAAAYVVEDGDWRDEFWNGRSGDVLDVTHYAIATGDCLLECLANHFVLFPAGYDPEVAHEQFLAALSPKLRNP